MMKKENKKYLIIGLIILVLFLMNQGKEISETYDLNEDLMNKQARFSDAPWHLESRLAPMSEEDKNSYIISRFSKKTYIVGGATCSSEPDISNCIESDLYITCPSSWEGQTNYGCSIDVWTAVNDDCAYDVHDAYLGKYDRTPGQSLSLSEHDAYFFDIYMCTDKECSCGTETNKGCGDWGCDDDEMTRRRTCTPHECGGDYDGWMEHGDEWYYCATGFDECLDCDSHDYYTCSLNDIYWYDSCDNREEKKEDCGLDGCDYGSTECKECTPQVSYKCDNNDIYWYDSCGNEGAMKEDCGSDGCTDGATICSGGTIPSLIEVSRTIKDYNDLGVENKIIGTFVIKNVGTAMTSNWILEMQVNNEEKVRAFVGEEQKTCNPATPENVHKEFKLGAGEQVTIELTSSNIPESVITELGNTYVLGVITEYCGCTEPGCYKDPYKAGDTFGSFVVKATSTQTCSSLGGTIKTSSCDSLNMTTVSGATDLSSGQYCCKTKTGEDVCGGECDGIIMVCDENTGECKVNKLMYLIGALLIGLIAFKSLGGKS